MAVSQPDVPAFAFLPERRSVKPARPHVAAKLPRSAAAVSARKPLPARTAGMLVGRPDLSDDAVIAAIAERMAFEGRDETKAAAVLKAAFAGRPVAVSFLRRLVLPAPQASLPMPMQAILREAVSEPAPRTAWLRRMSFGR